jgi:hypothetical protein
MRYLVLIGLIVGGLLGYYVLWSHLADQMAARADAWIEGQRRIGREAGYESRRIWGFPYRLSLTLKKTYWADRNLPTAPALQADEITAHLQLWNQEHVIFELSGPQAATWREAGVERKASLSTERFRASLVTDGAGNWLRAAADLGKPKLYGPSEGPMRGEWVATKLLLHIRRAENVPPSTDFAIQIDNSSLPAQADGVLGRELHGLRLTGNLRGGIYGGTVEDALSTWRDSGGVADFSKVALTWGTLIFNGNGSLSIDRDFRPIGAMAGVISAADPLLAALQSASLVDAQQGEAAKQAALAAPDNIDRGNDRSLYIAATAQDGQLSVYGVPLLRLPSVLPGR